MVEGNDFNVGLCSEDGQVTTAGIGSLVHVGTIGDALVVTLPGSPGGVRDGMAVLTPLLSHVLEQIVGGDHKPGGGV